MPEEKAGKIFYSPEEVAAAGWGLSEEERSEVQKMFDDFNANRNAVLPEPTAELPGRFGGDDLAGTEYEGWTPDGDRS
ncbi:hypothetical protein D5S18_10185 [Nocardia panacis]|uniref:Uncharacterized protein n=1 Tax=Nocardia panacis TaxID=2340916 RepID=A0A3A4KT03_9NOCA|nr:hypothetical protein [Nocardia panacis]RJO76636.1 hypothetical protein D5S18_10185 [Nocardia panacis]